MANHCIAGEGYVKVDGRQLSVRGTLTISTNQYTRETVAGLDGIHGYTKDFHPQYIEIEITNRPAFPLTDLANITDATVTAELRTARSGCCATRGIAVTSSTTRADGSATIRFDGMDMRRQRSAA